MVPRPDSDRPKVFGIGLNKTGTKTLAHYLKCWGYRHRTYDSFTTQESPSFRLYESGQIDALVDSMSDYDSCEDWPWPLLYRELDERWPDARFVLTLRADPEVWYRSLCRMAVRIGPMPLYERSVYGFATPHGHKREHVERYLDHNARVQEHFADRPHKLLTLCWDSGEGADPLARFLGLEGVDTAPVHVNSSPKNVYAGDNPWLARAHRLSYRVFGASDSLGQRALASARRRLGRS